MTSLQVSLKFSKCLGGRSFELNTKFDSMPLSSISLRSKHKEVLKHNLAQAAVSHKWLGRAHWSLSGYASGIYSNTQISTNNALFCIFVCRKISTLNFWDTEVFSSFFLLSPWYWGSALCSWRSEDVWTPVGEGVGHCGYFFFFFTPKVELKKKRAGVVQQCAR